jgi:MoaE-MoaD fusion protein
MRIRVLFFGVLKDLTGLGSDSPELPEHATVADVLDHYERRLPRLKELMSSLAMSVNQEYASPEVHLKNGDEVALLPPVSGGSYSGRVALVHEPIDPAQLLVGIKHPEDGAVVTFDGIVRNHTRGRPTLFLEYEAYENMALKQMEELAAQARSQFPVHEVVIVHRLGHLEIGETSVFIAVGSVHRAAAFDACRWLIDTLKRVVPIWKKEFFEDGAVWADGEPFPDTIIRAEGTHSGGA